MDHANGEGTQRLTRTDAGPRNRSAGGVVEPSDQIEQRRLPAPRWTEAAARRARPVQSKRTSPAFERDDFFCRQSQNWRAKGLQP